MSARIPGVDPVTRKGSTGPSPALRGIPPDEGPPSHGSYWEEIGSEWLDREGEHLWRRCSDEIHCMWLDREASELQGVRVLKTDMFDEAFGGGLVSWFDKRGNEVVACDLAYSTARRAALESRELHAVVADVLNLPFSSGSFGCILSDSTLDHFGAERTIGKSLSELERVMQAGGTLLLTLDNPRHPVVWIRNLFPGFWRKLGVVPYHVGVTCTAARLEYLIGQAGLTLVRKGAIMHCPRVLLVPLCKWIERRLGIHEPPAALLRWLRRFETLGSLPSRLITGHFLAFVATKPS